ncbi:MAG: hypothetical protein WC263_03945 [Candidatus Micrarchaeia archaeon]|jgi:hypothetical protein
MANVTTAVKGDERKNAILFLRCQSFYQRNCGAKKEPTTVLNGVTFTLFTASRLVALNAGAFEKFVSGLKKEGRRQLYEEALGKGRPLAGNCPLPEPAFA